MNKFLKAIIIVTFLYGFFFAVILAEDQKAVFGNETAGFLLISETVICGLAGLALFLKKKQRCRLSAAALLTAISLFCFLVGWYVHPCRVNQRVSDRIIDLAAQKLDFQAELQNASPERSKQIEIQLSRLNTELMARRLELKAAELRQEGDPKYLKNNFKMYSWWFFAIMSALAAACNYGLSRKPDSGGRMP